MDTDTTQNKRMLDSLRDAFRKRLPSGLTPAADGRLQQTLQHYTREVGRVKGQQANEQEILRETYDSMAKWYRRHVSELVPVPMSELVPMTELLSMAPSVPIIEHAVAPDVYPGLGVIGGKPFDSTNQESNVSTDDYLRFEVTDPLAMFERMKEARTSVAVPMSTVTESTPIYLPPELKSIETRPVVNKQTFEAKDLLQRQEDVVKYRETEHNLILNSKDRNWLVNTKENRYNFSVQLDSAYIPTEQNPQITIRNRFRNIVRVEFVKAILPIEGLDVVLTRDCSDNAIPDASFTSALGLPFINVTLDEITGNNVGTTTDIDKSLAICQYDAAWKSDHLSATTMTSRGYTLFFPKLMKAQRIYAPAPLSSFQRLSFELLTPENTVLSKAADAFSVGSIFFGQAGLPSCYDTSGYMFIQTKEWFPLWAFSHLDRVTFSGLNFFSATAASESGFRVLADWLGRPAGHVVVGIGYGSGVSDVSDGANGCGYANTIILQNRLTNPATDGTCDVDPFTGSDAAEAVFAAELASFPSTLQKGGVLNLSRQVQLVLRVITREMDSTTNIRPDNI